MGQQRRLNYLVNSRPRPWAAPVIRKFFSILLPKCDGRVPTLSIISTLLNVVSNIWLRNKMRHHPFVRFKVKLYLLLKLVYFWVFQHHRYNAFVEVDVLLLFPDLHQKFFSIGILILLNVIQFGGCLLILLLKLLNYFPLLFHLMLQAIILLLLSQ